MMRKRTGGARITTIAKMKPMNLSVAAYDFQLAVSTLLVSRPSVPYALMSWTLASRSSNTAITLLPCSRILWARSRKTRLKSAPAIAISGSSVAQPIGIIGSFENCAVITMNAQTNIVIDMIGASKPR